MICLTGDIHHEGLNTGNQQHSDRSEIQTALDFLQLLDFYQVKMTLFVSGKTFQESPKATETLAQHALVEIGGHNWDCFEPSLWHRFWNKAAGSYNGPRWYQRWDVEKTKRTIEAVTHTPLRCWRNHMYMHGPYTEQVLAAAGIEICADGVKKAGQGLEWHPAGIYNFPLNIMPDHEHIYHAERTPEWVEAWVKRYDWSDDFGSDSYPVDVWADKVLAQLQHNEANGHISHLILHPLTMYLCDRYASARRILSYLAQCETVHMQDLISQANTLHSMNTERTLKCR
jgi:hypothetical protein